MNHSHILKGTLVALALITSTQASSVYAADVVDTAATVPDLSTLISLVETAGLVDDLKTAEDITVFAPTNEAFAHLPNVVTKAIEKDPSILSTILLYHISPDRLRAADVVVANSIDTLANDPINVRTPGSKVFVDRAQVTATDIETDNATVHLINRVMIPWNLIARDVWQALRHN